MKISSKGRYGLRAIIDLALNSNGEHVSLISIAERQDISKNYLEQVFSSLRKAGIVKSVKGSQGGYILAMEASELKIGEVLRVLEGNLSVINEEATENMNRVESVIKSCVWDQIDKKVNSVVDQVTLEDLVQEYNKGGETFMYYI